jgi:ABC-2 type transport system ATP-binding protein
MSDGSPLVAPAPERPPAIRVRHLHHRFGALDVLRDVSFDVAHGEIFGFIGPNGAGKTTTIRVMATLLEPMAGRVEIDGVDVTVDPESVRRTIGYMPDHAGVYERITVREYLEFFADAFRVQSLGVVDAVLELTDLGRLADRLVVTMSKGMKQRLQLARILLHDPKVLILDEPASDLDPRARIEIRDLLVELRRLGKTVFLSSHILTELADICTSVAILERGRLVVAGPIAEIGAQLAAQRTASSLGEPSSALPLAGAPTNTSPSAYREPAAPTGSAERGLTPPPPNRRVVKVRLLGSPDAARHALLGQPGVLDATVIGGGLHVGFFGDDAKIAEIVASLVAAGAGVIGVEQERSELERIFLEVTRGEVQ